MNELAILLLQAAVAAMKASPGAASLPVNQQPQTAPMQPQTAPMQPQTAPMQPQTAPMQPQTAPAQPQAQNYIPPAPTPVASLPVSQEAPSAAQNPTPPILQQLIQQMNREGAQFDMPPAGPSVYDRLSEHLAGLYSNSGTTGNTVQ